MRIRHRTTARTLLLVAASLGLAAGTAAAQPPDPPAEVGGLTAPTAGKPSAGKPTAGKPTAGKPASAKPAGGKSGLIFPVVGPVQFSDDYGDARGHGSHQGNDIMAPRRALAVAVEAGTVKFWGTSARAGCMLYLYGASGTTYLYIHLNNDLTSGNDNRGKCVAGVAYARGLTSGAKVAAGAPVGYVGDSGDANGGSPHLHFEVHPRNGRDVNPYPYLLRARRLLYAAQPGTDVSLKLNGKVVKGGATAMQLRVDGLRASTGLSVKKVARTVELFVPPTTVVFNPVGALIAAARLAAAKAGQPATVWTARTATTLATALGEPLALATDRVSLTR